MNLGSWGLHILLPTLLLTALFTLPLAAQEPPPEDDTYIIDVTDDRPDIRAPTAWRHTLLTDRLRWSGGELGELLEESPGVHVRRSGAAGSPTTLTLRGASPVQVLVLFDGLALNPSQGGGVDLALIPPGLIKKVEIYRGGSAARFGSGALGGAVNLVPVIPENGLRATAQAGYGSFDTRRAAAGVSGGGRSLRGLVSVDVLQADNDFPFTDDEGTEHTRVGADVDRLGVVATVIGQPRRGLTLRLSGLATEADRGSAGPSEFQDRFAGARLQNSDWLLAGEIAGEWEEGNVALGPSWRAHEVMYDNPEPLLDRGFAYMTRHHEQSAGGRVRASYYPTWASAPGLDAVALHLEANVDRIGFTRESAGQDTQTLTRTHGSSGLVGEAFVLKSKLSLVASGRVERIADRDQSWSKASPSIGLRATPADNLLLMGNLSRAWRAPSLDELYLDTEGVQGDPTLNAEDAVSADFGVRWEDPRLSAEWVGYWLDIDELILFLPASAWVYRAQNVGAATAYGSEVALGVTPLTWLQLRGTWTWAVARFDVAPQDTLPGRPTHQGSLEASARGWDLRGFLKARGRTAVFLDNFENLSNPGFVTLDAGAQYTGPYGLSVSLTGRNLLDQRQVVDALQAPLPGLSFYAQVTYTQGSEPTKDDYDETRQHLASAGGDAGRAGLWP